MFPSPSVQEKLALWGDKFILCLYVCLLAFLYRPPPSERPRLKARGHGEEQAARNQLPLGYGLREGQACHSSPSVFCVPSAVLELCILVNARSVRTQEPQGPVNCN